MSEFSELMLSFEEKQAWDILQQAGSIVITSHIHPDGDAIGSSLALAGYCKGNGKEAEVVIDDDIPQIYDYLKGYSSIMQPENLCDKKWDLMVIVDTNSTRIGKVSGIKTEKVINIDHHDTNPQKCDYHIIRGDCTSTTELLYRLFEMNKYEINSDIANCLYTGLITDAVFFKAPTVTADSYRIAAELVDCGIDPAKIAKVLEQQTYNELLLVSRALEDTSLYFDGSVAGVCMDESFDTLERTDGIIDKIRYINGIKMAFLLKHEKNGYYRVRMRSEVIDVSKIAKENGGGGHIDAAGFIINAPSIKKAKQVLLGEIKKWLV